MMGKNRLANAMLAAALGVAVLAAPASAQITEVQPAEFPPASFKGKQYVDSNGCVFIRAGIDGNVSWVPRVSRDRKIICGFRPSLSGAEAAAAPATPAPAPAPQIVVEAPTETASASAAAPAPAARPAPRRAAAPVVVRQTAPKPQPKRVVRKAAPAPKPRIIQTAPAVPAPGQLATACPQASPLAQQYLQGSGVRCGPQGTPIVSGQAVVLAPAQQAAAVTRQAEVHHDARPVSVPVDGTHVQRGDVTRPVTVTAQTRIVPKHVARNRLNTQNVVVPKGYQPAWEDGRLNPKRAEQTLEGRGMMNVIWTNTLPRRLINQANGRDVTASVPLVYPYTDIEQQSRELGQVTIVRRDGQIMKRVLRNPGVKPLAQHKAKRKPVYSSRSAPKTVKPAAQPQAASVPGRYVQVGTYRNEANARRAAQSIANMGMRARIGKVRRGGQTLMNVQAGPFASGAPLNRAVSQLRRAGYSDAFVR